MKGVGQRVEGRSMAGGSHRSGIPRREAARREAGIHRSDVPHTEGARRGGARSEGVLRVVLHRREGGHRGVARRAPVGVRRSSRGLRRSRTCFCARGGFYQLRG